MNKKFHISKFTNKETIYNTLDAIDPDGEKMKKAKAYMEEQGYDPSKSSEVEKVFAVVNKNTLNFYSLINNYQNIISYMP